MKIRPTRTAVRRPFLNSRRKTSGSPCMSILIATFFVQDRIKEPSIGFRDYHKSNKMRDYAYKSMLLVIQLCKVITLPYIYTNIRDAWSSM